MWKELGLETVKKEKIEIKPAKFKTSKQLMEDKKESKKTKGFIKTKKTKGFIKTKKTKKKKKIKFGKKFKIF